MRAVRLTSRGYWFAAAALVTFVFSAAASAPAGLYATGLLLGLLLLGTVFVLAGHAQVRVDREFEPVVIEPGQPTTVRLTVQNLAPLGCAETAWTDRLPRTVAGDARGTLTSLGARGSSDDSVTRTYTVTSSTRGRHQVGPLTIRASDPFGLVRRTVTRGETQGLVVLPRRYRLDPIRPVGVGSDGATRPAPQFVGVGSDDVIARPYAPGDAVKRLHWKATAHRGELMVRQEEQHDNPRANVVLDVDAYSHGTEHGRRGWEYSAGFEWSVAATASMVAHLVDAGYVVDVSAGQGTVARTVAEGRDTVREVMLDLAEVEPNAQATVVADTDEQLTFLVAGVLDADRAEHWLRSLGRGAAVHALMSDATRPQVREILERSGWRLSTYGAQSDIPDAWRGLDAPTTGSTRAI